jgi:predicted transposase YdaD
MTVAGAANCKLDYNAIDWKGDDIVCTVFEAERAEGREEGREEGALEAIKASNLVNQGITTVEELVKQGISPVVARMVLSKN